MKIRIPPGRFFGGRLRPMLAQCGFTTIELLIVITIAGVLAVIAVPSFRSILATTRLNSAVGLVMSDLNQARGEAIKRNVRVLVCVRNAAGTRCGSTATTATDWRPGWVVCVADATSTDCADATATTPNPLLVRPALDASLTLTGSAAVIRFNPNSSQGVGGAAATLTLGGSASRTITVAGTGNITK